MKDERRKAHELVSRYGVGSENRTTEPSVTIPPQKCEGGQAGQRYLAFLATLISWSCRRFVVDSAKAPKMRKVRSGQGWGGGGGRLVESRRLKLRARRH